MTQETHTEYHLSALILTFRKWQSLNATAKCQNNKQSKPKQKFISPKWKFARFFHDRFTSFYPKIFIKFGYLVPFVPNHLEKWLSVHLRTKWLWIWVPLQSLEYCIAWISLCKNTMKLIVKIWISTLKLLFGYFNF